MKGIFRAIYVLGFVLNIAANVSAAPAPVLAQFAIDQQRTFYEREQSVQQDSIRLNKQKEIDYLHQLETNWDKAITTPPRDLPTPETAQIQETYQFYFEGRTNYDQPDLETLLHPRMPLDLGAFRGPLSEADKTKLLHAGLRLRLCWFRLLADLKPDKVLSNHQFAMESVNLSAIYLHAFTSNPVLLPMLTVDDFNAIVESVVGQLNIIDDTYLKNLGAEQQERFHGRDNYDTYEGFRENLATGFSLFYQAAWDLPACSALDQRVLALNSFINYHLETLLAVLKAGRLHPQGNKMMLSQISLAINGLLSVNFRQPAPTPAGRSGKVIQYSKTSDRDLRLISEVCQYQGVQRGTFNVDCQSGFAALIADVKSGNGDEAFKKNICNPADNLYVPLHLLVDYVRRHPTASWKWNLYQIQAKLEGLDDLAKSIRHQ